jgi:hypothetical protein
VGVTGASLPWPFHATDVRGVRGGAPPIRLDWRERHRRAAFVAFLSDGSGQCDHGMSCGARGTRDPDGLYLGLRGRDACSDGSDGDGGEDGRMGLEADSGGCFGSRVTCRWR